MYQHTSWSWCIAIVSPLQYLFVREPGRLKTYDENEAVLGGVNVNGAVVESRQVVVAERACTRLHDWRRSGEAEMHTSASCSDIR